MQRDTTAKAPAFVAFVDGLGVWTDHREAGGSPEPPRARAKKVHRRWRRAGLGKVDLHSTPYGSGVFSSLAPLWHVPYDVEARAAGRQPRDLRAVLESLFRYREFQRTRGGYWLTAPRLARITRLDLAIIVTGINSELALRTLLPSIRDVGRDEGDDLVRVRGWQRRRRGFGRVRGPWVELDCNEVIYGQRGRTSSGRKVAVYADRPSPLVHVDDFVTALKYEVRLSGRHVDEFRAEPMALLPFLDPKGIWNLVARHVEFPRHEFCIARLVVTCRRRSDAHRSSSLHAACFSANAPHLLLQRRYLLQQAALHRVEPLAQFDILIHQRIGPALQLIHLLLKVLDVLSVLFFHSPGIIPLVVTGECGDGRVHRSRYCIMRTG